MKTLIAVLALVTNIVSAQTIVCPPDAPANVKLAAKEIRRYVYLRTGELWSIGTPSSPAVSGSASDRRDGGVPGQFILKIDPAIGAQEYRIAADGITGGSDIGVLYGAYRYAELLGVRFYLHGDVVPDERLKELPAVTEETGKPMFELRGVNPWGYHPQGMDAWGTDDYKAIITQLAKMRMNFIGIHSYPFREAAPLAAASSAVADYFSATSEPTVWHGLASGFDAQGRVNSSCPTVYYNTLANRYGGYVARKTGDYCFGGSALFERDDWAPAVLAGHCPAPTTMEGCNEVFNRTAEQFHEAFTLARQLGVKTCLGTEAPLTIPPQAQRELKAQGNDPASPEAIRKVYEGTFKRIMAAHPLDYYWIWTHENWTHRGNTAEQYQAVLADIKLAAEARANVNAPFQLATAGWVLGPGVGLLRAPTPNQLGQDRAAFDRDLPKGIPVSAISRSIGNTVIDSAFARINGRGKWAIPWLEGDGGNGLAGIQLWVGRVRRDAVDAREFGCTGLMGLHWRTDILAPNASALALAAWDQSWHAATDAKKPRQLPSDDFYADYAQANFGLPQAGKIFTAMDGEIPRSNIDDCPVGRLTPDKTPWNKVAPRYRFVDDFAKLRPQISGAGNRERFDYWQNTFKYYRGLAQLRCALAKPDAAALTRLYADTYQALLATVNSPGGLSMVVNMENNAHWGPLIAKHAAQPWPKQYQAQPRLIVPCVRSVVNIGESLTLKIIALPATQPTVHFRPLGQGEWKEIPATHVARAVYKAELPAAREDFEYYITAGEKLVWPATAPSLNQTVVILE